MTRKVVNMVRMVFQVLGKVSKWCAEGVLAVIDVVMAVCFCRFSGGRSFPVPRFQRLGNGVALEARREGALMQIFTHERSRCQFCTRHIWMWRCLGCGKRICVDCARISREVRFVARWRWVIVCNGCRQSFRQLNARYSKKHVDFLGPDSCWIESPELELRLWRVCRRWKRFYLKVDGNQVFRNYCFEPLETADWSEGIFDPANFYEINPVAFSLGVGRFGLLELW